MYSRVLRNQKGAIRNIAGAIGIWLLLFVLMSSAHSQENDCAADYLCTKEPKRIALVIGNINYTNLEPIPSAATDAEQMRQRLTDLGFDVEVHNDVRTPFEFWNQIVPAFRQKLTTGDFVVFYFSGHGFSYGADSFIAPTELPLGMTVQNVTDFAIAIESFKATLETHSPGLVLFIIDACRSTGALRIAPIADNQNENLIGKGPATMQNQNSSVNAILAFAAQPGHVAFGTSLTGQPSAFTAALISHLLTEGVPFSVVFKDAAAELATSTQPTQVPGTFDWSRTDPYLKPSARVLAEEEEAWDSALLSGRWQNVSVFVQRYSVSRYSFAGQKWLADHPRNNLASTFAAASPIAVERAWRTIPTERVAIRRLSIPLGFTSSLVENKRQNLRAATDEDVGIVRSGMRRNQLAELRTGEKFMSEILPPSLLRKDFYRNSLAYSLANITAHRIAVTTRALTAHAEPNVSASVVADLPERSVLQVSDIIVQPDESIWIEALGAESAKPFYVQVEAGTTPSVLELGRSIKQVYVPVRAKSLPELVDATVIKTAVADLKAQGWKITWISLATGVTFDEVEQASREARIANAEYILEHSDIPLATGKDNASVGSHITSVIGRQDVIGNGVRIRFFGVK